MSGYKREYHKRHRKEINEIDQRLRWILDALNLLFIMKFRFGLVITCLFRTVAENILVKGLKYSAHLVGRAVDIRTEYLTKKQIEFIVITLQSIWGDFLYVIYHNDHIHINIKYRYKI